MVDAMSSAEQMQKRIQIIRAFNKLNLRMKIDCSTIDLTGENTVADDLEFSFAVTIPTPFITIEEGGP